MEVNSQYTPSSPLPSRFLLIPRELRDRIYRYVLIADVAILWPSPTTSNDLYPSLLATCKQIHREAGPILYKYNRFTFCHPSDCNVFRHIMDSRHVVNMSLVAFKIRECDVGLWLAYITTTNRERGLASDLPNLQGLVIFLRQQGHAHDIDEENGFGEYYRNRHLKHLCMSLEHRMRASVAVVFSARVRDDVRLEEIRAARPELFVDGGLGYVRTRAFELRAGIHVELELLSAEGGGLAWGSRRRHLDG